MKPSIPSLLPLTLVSASLLLPAAARAVDDPVTHTDYDCLKQSTPTFDGKQGRMFRPRAQCGSNAWDDRLHPIAAIMPGNSYTPSDYDYLAEHLARNGFVVFTLGSNAVMMADFLDAAPHEHTRGHLFDTDNVVLIGHSKSGKHVVDVAERFRTSGSSLAVKAIVQITPNDSGALAVKANRADSQLVFGATHDEDLEPFCLDCGGTPVTPKGISYHAYDRGGIPDHGWDGFTRIDKAFVEVQGASHASFASGSSHSADVTKGYVHAFVRWQVYGEEDYKEFFTGERTPGALSPSDVRQAFLGDGAWLLDDFENGDTYSSDFATITAFFGPSDLTFEEHPELYLYEGDADLAYSVPHPYGGLSVVWTDEGEIEWQFDSDVAHYPQYYDVLTFRVAQVYDSVHNDGSRLEMEVELEDIWGDVSAVDLVEYRHILPPEPAVFQALQGAGLDPTPHDRTTSFMETVRIWLHDFDVDLSAIRYLRLRFRNGGRGSASGEVVLDDLGFDWE